MKFLTIIGVLFLMPAQISGAVAGDERPAAGPQRSASAEGATIGFRNLEDGDIVPPKFIVQFRIGGMGVAPAGSNIENTGHHHLLIDLDNLPDFNQPLPANEHIRHFGKAQAETELELSAGEHTLQLLFADYLHIPHDPPVVSKKITIVVSPDAPAQGSGEDDAED